MTKDLSTDQYDKHNYREMVNCCEYLDNGMIASLLRLFSKYVELFSGPLGRVPGPPIKLKLKKRRHPFSFQVVHGYKGH